MSQNGARLQSRFAICCFSFEPRRITETLNVAPDRTSTEAPDKSGLQYWEILGPDTKSLAIEDHITGLIDRLRPTAESLLRIRSMGGPDVEFNVIISVDRLESGSKPHLALSPQQSEFLAKYRITLVLDMI